jgi:plastocyanin
MMMFIPLLLVPFALFAVSANAAPLTLTVTNAKQQPLPNAAVSVYVKGVAPRIATPGNGSSNSTSSSNSTGSTSAALTQRNRQFIPSMLVVQTGTAVTFPNEDTVRHHIYSFSPIKPFEIKLYVGTPAAPVVFDKAGTAVLGCNIHDQMIGYVHVVDTPYFAVTDARGVAVIEVPPGDHRLRTWHVAMGAETAPAESTVKVAEGGASQTVKLQAD